MWASLVEWLLKNTHDWVWAPELGRSFVTFICYKIALILFKNKVNTIKLVSCAVVLAQLVARSPPIPENRGSIRVISKISI